MPAAWKWYACLEGERDECAHEADTREASIASIARDWPAGTAIEVMEARLSTAKRFEGHHFVPFTAIRNRETVILGDNSMENRP